MNNIRSKKSSVKVHRGGDDDNISMMSDVSSTRNDLLQMGIDLDENAIQRMQSLGMNKVFLTANKTASILRSRHVLPAGATPQINYRHVVEDRDTEGNVTAILDTTFQGDSQKAISVMKNLNNAESQMDARMRSALDKFIQQFRIQYARSPLRFLRCFLGLTPSNKPMNQVQVDADIQRLVLKSRFMDEHGFKEGLARLKQDTTIPHQVALFQMICEQVEFQGKKREVVDLCVFLTLLKTAGAQSRRSFDYKTSRLATDIEFWENILENKRIHQETFPVGSSSPTGPSSRVTSKGVLHKERTCLRGADSCELLQGRDRPTNRQEQEQVMRGRDSAAALLGCEQLVHRSVASQGRNVFGAFCFEDVNRTDIPAALSSPVKTRAAQPVVPRQSRESTCWSHSVTVPERSSVHMEGAGVAAALGTTAAAVTRAQGLPRGARFNSSHVLQRETDNRTTVAGALGCTREDMTGRGQLAQPQPARQSSFAFSDHDRSKSANASHRRGRAEQSSGSGSLLAVLQGRC